ncbi:MAG: copper resistance protein CopC [Salinarimonadaceae bacterium]|nr:MAG: copper resistance protein CopC [Salinarimonadaceae bacterium]
MTRRALPLSLAFIGLLLTLLSAGAALAHAQLRSAEPRAGAIMASAPEAVRLVFNESVAPLQARWITPDGSVHDVEARSEGDALVVPLPDDPGQGTLVLSWRVASADGHPVGGTHSFSIGAPSENAGVVRETGAGAATFAAFAKFVLSAALAFGPGGAFALALFAANADPARGARRAALIASALVPPAALLLAAATALDLSGRPLNELAQPQPWMLLAQGPVLGTLVTAVLAGALAAFSLSGRAARTAGAGALGLAALSFALSGHAATAEPRWLATPAIALHAGAALFWIGALPVLLSLVACGAEKAPGALARFSRLATAPIAALFLTGGALAAVQLGEPAALVDTSYGLLLCAKIACALAMLALAGLNRLRLAPALAKGASGARRAVSRSIGTEIALAMAILALASAFRLTPPPRAAALEDEPAAYVHLHGLRAMADLVVAPGRAGPNAISATVFDDTFAPFDPMEVTVLLSLPARGLEPVETRLTRGADGVWTGTGTMLPLPGIWTARIEILIDDFTREIIEGEMEIAL